MARKRDIKQFRQTCEEVGLTSRERHEASEDLHAEKGGIRRAGAYELGRAVGFGCDNGSSVNGNCRRSRCFAINVLRSMRGSIVDAKKAYPDVLHVELRDSAGELWRLATQDAEWSPTDPPELVGQLIEDAEIDESSGELRCKLSSGSVLDVRPGSAQEADDDPPIWELITPRGVLLEFGPGVRWQISGADAPASPRR